MDWATPTPIPYVPGTPVLDLGADVGVNLAEDIVQGYQQAQLMGALNLLIILLLVLLIVGGIWSVMRHAQRL